MRPSTDGQNTRRPPPFARIAGIIRERRHVDVQAIGASAVNQAIKAIAIARNYLALDGIQIVCFPEFVEIDIEGQERTAVKLIIEPR